MKGLRRRDFLKVTGLAGCATLTGCAGMMKDVMRDVFREEYEKILFEHEKTLYNIFYELPKHIHIAETNSKILKKNMKKDKISNKKIQKGAGIILNGKYLTMAHIIAASTMDILFSGEAIKINELNQETILYGNKLEKFVLDYGNDVAIFNLPKNLKIKDFPCKPTNKLKLGERIYIIGNPALAGPNIREGIISDLDSYGEYNLTINCFGVDIPFVIGDSGSPILNSNYELLGLASICLEQALGYVKKIGEFTKYL